MFLTEQFEMTTPIGPLGSMGGVLFSSTRQPVLFCFHYRNCERSGSANGYYSFAIAFGA